MNDKVLKRVMQKYDCTTIEELEHKREELKHQLNVLGEKVIPAMERKDHSLAEVNADIGKFEARLLEIESALKDTKN